MNPRCVVAALVAVSLGGSVLAPTPASLAAAPERSKPQVAPLAKQLISPLSLAVADDGTRYFSQNFAGLLMKQVPGAGPTVLFEAAKGGEVGAVSESDGVVTFAVSRGNNEKGTIKSITSAGKVSTLGLIHPVENLRNPDGRVRYGFRDLAPSCARQIPEQVPSAYRGVKETHPYATTRLDGTTYVADAGANAIYQIGSSGQVRPLAVIPPARFVVTPEAARGNGLPRCTVGSAYYFESVPTDVEVGPDGNLYVTTLPGGPEDGSVGALASVYRVRPGIGLVKEVVGGLVSATGLAVANNGGIYVAELFRGRISKVKPGRSKAKTYVEAGLPSDVEVGPSGVFALVDALVGLEPGSKPGGRLVRITP